MTKANDIDKTLENLVSDLVADLLYSDWTNEETTILDAINSGELSVKNILDEIRDQIGEKI